MVYKNGVGIRKSTLYADKGKRGQSLEYGEVFRGTACMEYGGSEEMVRISNDKCEWVPMKVLSNGKQILKKCEVPGRTPLLPSTSDPTI